MKKTLSILLTLIVFLSFLEIGKFTVSAMTSGDYTYTIVEPNAVITGYSGEDSIVDIPATLDGIDVVGIGDNAFVYNDHITSVNIPLGVANIGVNAFNNCWNMTSVNIPSTVVSIGDNAFMGCSSLNKAVFAGFSPSSFGVGVFSGCADGFVIYYINGISSWTNPWNSYFSWGYDIQTPHHIIYNPNGAISGIIPEDANAYSFNSLVTIPGNTGNLSKLYFSFIGWNTKPDGTGTNYMAGSKLNIDTEILTLYANGFQEMTLDDMQSSHPYTSFVDKTWIYSCDNADSLNITFSGTTLVENGYDYIYIMDKDDNNIEDRPFTAASLANQTKTVIGPIVKIRVTSDGALEEYGFRVTNITPVYNLAPIADLKSTDITQNSIKLTFSKPNSATNVKLEKSSDFGESWSDAQTAVTLSSNSTTATVSNLPHGPKYRFRLIVTGGERQGISNEIEVLTYGNWTPLEDFLYVNSGNQVTINGYKGAGGEIVVPNYIDGRLVTKITGTAFFGKSTLTSVTIPLSVTDIDIFTFKTCPLLTDIHVDESNILYSSKDGLLYDKYGTEILLCPQGKIGSISLPESVRLIGDEAFSLCNLLSEIILPQEITNIGTMSFSFCTALSGIVLPDKLATIGYMAFSNCSSLSEIKIPNMVTDLGDKAFSQCSSLTSITMPHSVTDIWSDTFMECSSLATIRGFIGTAAESFAIDNYLTFISLDLSANVKSFGNFNTFSDAVIGKVFCNIPEGAFVRQIENELLLPSNIFITIANMNSIDYNPGTTDYDTYKIGTGTVIKLKTKFYNINVENYTAILYGDVNGDADIDVTDMACIKLDLLKMSTLNGALKFAGDISNDKVLSVSDLLLIKRHITGIQKISQT